METITRRQFLRWLTALGVSTAGGMITACSSVKSAGPGLPTITPTVSPTIQPTVTAASSGAAPASAIPPAPSPAYLAVARGADPAEVTRRAVAALGGIERFVKSGANVIVKPNICNAYHGPEYASTTNPEVVAALIALCLGAGARRVRVMDFPFGGSAKEAYVKSGIQDAVKAANGEMELMGRLKYRTVEIPSGRAINKWSVYGDILDADVVINVPIAKNHGNTRLTLGMKNLMGVILDRSGFHSRGLDQCIADLNSVVRPQLTVVDAVRILTANGPTGGSLDDVKQMDAVIASADVVAADAYAATLFGLTGNDIDYIRLGAEMGLGQMDLTKIQIKEIQA